MRLIEMDYSGDELLQGFVRTEWPTRQAIADGQAADWLRTLLWSASWWPAVRPRSVAVRIAIELGRPITTVHSFVCAKPEEARLRKLLAGLLCTHGMAGGQTDAPQAGEKLEGRFVHPDETRLAIGCAPPPTAGGRPIQCNIRLADQLPQLLEAFATLGLPFAYEFQAMPWSLPRKKLRSFLLDMIRLAKTPGIPPWLAEDQRQLGDRLRRANYHVEECITTPVPEWQQAVSETLGRLLDQSIYAAVNVAPSVARVEAAAARAFANHVHSQLIAPRDAVAEDVPAAAQHQDVDRCLSCVPLGFIPSEIPADEREPLPDPVFDEKPFLFVSYARADGDHVDQMAQQLAGRGVSAWIGHKPVGEGDWVPERDARLRRCSGVLAFVTSSFAGSPYCGREIRVADALDKKIIPVFLEAVNLSGGLSFILGAPRAVMMTGQTDLAPVLSAIGTHAPMTCELQGQLSGAEAANDPIAIARRSYEAFVARDRATMERLLAQEFRLINPLEDVIKRDEYFDLCWPNPRGIHKFEFSDLVRHGDRVFVRYEAETGAGDRFRNLEVMTIRDGMIVDVEVYFGWGLAFHFEC